MRALQLLPVLMFGACSLLFDSSGGSGNRDAGTSSDDASGLAPYEVVCDSEGCGQQCMPGRPCILRCTSSSACSGLLDCGAASECIIACDSSSACRDLTCYHRDSCQILCAQFGTCSGDIDCRAKDCDVVCSGMEACRGGQVRCGATTNTCDIKCTGDDSCGSTISCGSAAAECEIGCTGDSTCSQDVTCNRLCTVSCSATSCSGAVDCRNSGDACLVDCIDPSCSLSITCPQECQVAADGCGNCTPM